MLTVELMALGQPAAAWLPGLAEALRHAVGWRCVLAPDVLDPGFAYLPARGQFSSSAILQHLEERYALAPASSLCQDGPGATQVETLRHSGRALLGVTDVDLALPIFTFVFGEAIDGGACAVISGHRLRQEFYGLPADPALFDQRLLKMALHEVGHTRGLRHCASWECVMATSYSIERLDLKSAVFCPSCASRI